MPFIERDYQIGGMDTPLTLQMEEPYQRDRDWVVEYRLIGLDDHFGRTSKVIGADKLDALANAFFKITAELEYLQRDCGLDISWMGEPRLGLIFIPPREPS